MQRPSMVDSPSEATSLSTTLSSAGVGAAAVSLTLTGAAIVGGILIGVNIIHYLPDFAQLATAGISIPFFISMSDKIVNALMCTYRQLAKPALGPILEESLKLVPIFAALGLITGAADSYLRGVASAQSAAALHPVLLKVGTEQPIAILPVSFAENATLLPKYAGMVVSPEDIQSTRNIWTAGVAVSTTQSGSIKSFISSLVQCVDAASSEEPIIVQVQGFASDREFLWRLPGKQKLVARDETDALNRRAASDRRRAVEDAIRATPEFAKHIVRMRPGQDHADLNEMRNRRVYVDRINDVMQPAQENMTRRAEIGVLYAPGCTAAEIAEPARI